MLVEFFFLLRKRGIKTSLQELLDLLTALERQLVFADIEAFYFLARTCLVKDERLFDKYDRAFSEYFQAVEPIDLIGEALPEAWLHKEMVRVLSEQERRNIEAQGGLDSLLQTLQQRLQEQKNRHQCGNKWIGTGGTSAFGHSGYNPEGIKIGGDPQQGQRKAVKVWQQRSYRNFDDSVELGTRQFKVALRKLRQFARTGAEQELDIDQTIHSTANNGGYLDIKWMPERHNAIKVLIFFDVGGSMDDHIQACETLFSAVHSEFKHLEYFYFHNCVYDKVWKDNDRRQSESIALVDVIHTFGRDYKLIFVGDATMGPYEITYPGGSVEDWNEEAGSIWMQRLTTHYNRHVWLNPQPQAHWRFHQSISVMRDLVDQRMYPLTLKGLGDAMSDLL